MHDIIEKIEKQHFATAVYIHRLEYVLATIIVNCKHNPAITGEEIMDFFETEVHQLQAVADQYMESLG